MSRGRMVEVPTDELTDHLTTWAAERADVRAMILISTRAIPGAPIDAYTPGIPDEATY